jgi:hypothetical protein
VLAKRLSDIERIVKFPTALQRPFRIATPQNARSCLFIPIRRYKKYCLKTNTYMTSGITTQRVVALARMLRQEKRRATQTETAMIISMDDYRRIDNEYDSGADADRRRAYERHGNALPALRLATVESEQAGPDLPLNFDDVDTREFIERAYALATQI